MRRAAAKVSATASCAVVSVSTPGVLPTATPAVVAAADVDVVVADGVVAVGATAGRRERVESVRVPRLGELADDAVARSADRLEQLVEAQDVGRLADLDAAVGGAQPLEPELARAALW